MRLYALNVRWLREAREFENFLDFVDGDRRAKALSHRFMKDRALSLGAGLLLNLALARQAPKVPWPPRIRLGAYGKPFLLEGGLFFNLSHSGEYAACAVGAEEVGLDIEEVGVADADVARRCFTPGELRRVMPDGARVDVEAFCRLWTLKESYIKRIGTGLSLDPLDFEIPDIQPLRIRRSQDARDFFLKLYEELPGYKLALCAAGGRFPDRVEFVERAELAAALRRE
jgi:4'-phosphopantetheinyl transferase